MSFYSENSSSSSPQSPTVPAIFPFPSFEESLYSGELVCDHCENVAECYTVEKNEETGFFLDDLSCIYHCTSIDHWHCSGLCTSRRIEGGLHCLNCSY